MGIEPTAQAWEAWVLPLYDARLEVDSNHPLRRQANAIVTAAIRSTCRWPAGRFRVGSRSHSAGARPAVAPQQRAPQLGSPFDQRRSRRRRTLAHAVL
jgi:hypothetical protein